MEYTILILLLPLASFLVLGLAGMKMRPAAAGAVGTAVLAVVALLSYWTAFEYFSAGRDARRVSDADPLERRVAAHRPVRCTSTWAFCSTRSR